MLTSWHTDGMYAQQWILHMAAFTLVPSLSLFNNLITKNKRTRYLFDTGAHKLSSVNNVNNVYDGVFVGASFEFCFERLYFAQLNFQKGKMGKNVLSCMNFENLYFMTSKSKQTHKKG